jgi:hypothetical protein
LRYRDEDAEVQKEVVIPVGFEQRNGSGVEPRYTSAQDARESGPPSKRHHGERRIKETKVFPFGVARNRLRSATKALRVPVNIVDSLAEADVLVTTKHFYRRRPKLVADAERRGTPIYVLRANTSAQMEAFLMDYFKLSGGGGNDALNRAMQETEEAIDRVLEGANFVELEPQQSFVRRYQHQMAQSMDLESRSFGKEPNRRVRIFRSDQ